MNGYYILLFASINFFFWGLFSVVYKKAYVGGRYNPKVKTGGFPQFIGLMTCSIAIIVGVYSLYRLQSPDFNLILISLTIVLGLLSGIFSFKTDPLKKQKKGQRMYDLVLTSSDWIKIIVVLVTIVASLFAQW